ncbi:MAG: 16S rRNA (adenine(1518)-N(6)/adenine(1519)-N(6))-dimethyltransferase RsmA [Candidatus Pacebacteria bacterium]|nr:16S rRNA (adenine(1518)-N(6)/adenine(1519)-N(6))-dimethyltransferase RsmA [Candidatus Paceibacterota bacterium]
MNQPYLPAKKSLGQNFLKSKKALSQMIRATNVTEHDLVIEIGPGKGALTRPLLETGARVIAFELDKRMIDYLQTDLSEYIKSGQLALIHQDVLEIDMADFFGKFEAYKLIANIPYYITNAIIRKFLETKYQPTNMCLLVQKEVAERIVFRDGKQSLLALAVAVYGDAKYIAKVDRKYFSPNPKVHSAIIHIGNISTKKIGNEKRQKLFFEIIRAGFAHKRKKTIRNLEKIADKKIWTEIFAELEIDENTRAEKLDLNKWLNILGLFEQKT